MSSTGHLQDSLDACRQIGRDRSLGLPGWVSFSARIPTADIFGEVEDVLWITAAGQNLAALEADAFSPLHTPSLISLLKLDGLTGGQYQNALYCSRVVYDAPLPPLEAAIHAVLPGRCAVQTCPETLLALANSASWRARLEQVYHGDLLVLPLGLSPFAAAKAVASASASFEGVFIPDFGLFTWGEDTRQATERTRWIVAQAERYLQGLQAWELERDVFVAPGRSLRGELATLRKTASDRVGYPLLLCMEGVPAVPGIGSQVELVVHFQQGSVTPAQRDVLQQPPLLKEDLLTEAARHDVSAGSAAVILDAELGALWASRTAGGALLLADVYQHACRVLARALRLGDFQPLFLAGGHADHVPWPQGMTGETAMFSGEIALVTGGASGIGKACVESLLERGAAVVSLDINPAVKTLYDCPDYLGLECDLTDEVAVIAAFEAAARAYGGLDMLVLNAGVFPGGIRIEALDMASWQKVMRINLDSYLTVMREAHPLLKHSPRGGRVVLNASKNVLAPGAGAAAYSASKAAVTQLARVAALEWGQDRIRINIIHPHAVLDTGIWTEEVLQARAAYYGLTLQEYKTRNLLRVEINSHDVGELVAEMLGPLFAKITGAQIPVDGGSDRVI